MCAPTSLITSALQLVQLGVENQEANDRADKNEARVREASKNAFSLIGMRQQQEQMGAAQTIYQMDLEARKADAKTRVAAGESGVAGASIDALLADIERQRLMAASGTQKNADASVAQLQEEKKGVEASRKAQLESVQRPNPYLTGLKAGSIVIGGGFQAQDQVNRNGG